MLEVEDLSVYYDRVAALKGVDLTVAGGELVTVIGPNGAGKSTLLLTIAGALRPARGDIRLEGQSVVALTPEQRVRRGIVLVPERRRIFTGLTVADNLQVGLRGPAVRNEARLDAILERFPILRERFRSSASVLSGGEQQQLALARALLLQPRLLLVDEPSLGLAPLFVELIFSVLEDLRRSGTTTLLVEQNAFRAMKIADRAYVMQTGAIILAGSAEDMREREDIARLYLGGRATVDAG